MTFEGVMPVTEVMGYRPNNNNGANFEGIKPVTGEITGYRTSNNVVVVHSKVERMKGMLGYEILILRVSIPKFSIFFALDIYHRKQDFLFKILLKLTNCNDLLHFLGKLAD